jgi:hypothetical protein
MQRMTPTRKERIERAALALWINGLAYESAIAKAIKFIDAIDALPATERATARVPDTTTPLKPGDEVRVIGPSSDGMVDHVGRCGVVTQAADTNDDCFVDMKDAGDYFPRASLDGPLNRQPDHIPDAGEKVELPGKWTARDPEKDAIHFGGIIPRPGASIGVAINSEEAQDIIEAANKLRELTFAAAFRAGVEAAAATLPDNSVNPDLIRKMLAIQPPALD